MKEIFFKLLVIGAVPGGYFCAIRAGQLGIDTVIVEAMTRPPKGKFERSTGSEPVAITTVSARMICWPVSVSTS
ncbi:hypothetical protein ACC699_40275, partial [Rhizobium ruizarguesonis]